jgi:hypothetical protein
MKTENTATLNGMDLLQYASILHRRLPNIQTEYLTKLVLAAPHWTSIPRYLANGDTHSRPTRCTVLDSLVSNQNVMIKTARMSHRVMPIIQPSNIPLAGLRESISRSLVIDSQGKMLLLLGFISIIVPGPSTPSWQSCVRTSMGLPPNEKRERVTFDPSPAEKEGKYGVSLEVLHACAVPIPISLVLFRIDNN